MTNITNRPGIICQKSFIAAGAHVSGTVMLGEYSSVWFNTTIRGDVESVIISRYSNVQDNSSISSTQGYPCILGEFVSVGHNCTIQGCVIEDNCLIGMGATIMKGVHIGTGSIIAAGAMVAENMIIPPHSQVVGNPAKVTKQVQEKFDSIHSQAVKYKTLWTKQYGLLPDASGEVYGGEAII